MSAKNYKDTLNLPNTKFAMKANLVNKEPKILDFWQQQDIYKKMIEQKAEAQQFVLPDGPPYANGDIHLGHAVNKILKGMVICRENFNGKQTPFIPVWDCHGLPIEREIEKKHGKPGVKVSKAEFRKLCKKFAQKNIDRQKKDFMRLGVIADWQNYYATMQNEFESIIVKSVSKIIQNNYLHKGFKPVYWCSDCNSSLAEAEVEYKDKISPSIYLKFACANTVEFLQKFNINTNNIQQINILVWTTTPWTLMANEAVALHADLEYSLIEVNYQKQQQFWIVAKELLTKIQQQFDLNNSAKILATIPGKSLENLILNHPFKNKKVPIVLGEHVNISDGTGCVHTAPSHGLEDYAVGLKYNLSIHHDIAANGCFHQDTPIVGGQHISKANQIIIDKLKEVKSLIQHNDFNHSYPHCWRHKSPLFFLAMPQWFIKLDTTDLRQKTLQAIDKVQWIPSWGKERIKKMTENRPDWCVSRQRTWCMPLPIFIKKQSVNEQNANSKQLHPRTHELMEIIANKIAIDGLEAWYDLDIRELLGDDADEYEKSNDTLDVWFDSGVLHTAVIKNNNFSFPADLYLEGSDQHRGWFSSSLLTSIAMYGEPPYKSVLTHGFVVDKEGRKMSKSLGNVVAPQDIINKYGADILRLWVSSNDYTREMTISNEIIARISDCYRRIRNTCRFLLSNLYDFEAQHHLLKVEKCLPIDQWSIKFTDELQQKIRQAYDNYEFHKIYQYLHHFCTQDMGGFYLDILKDRLYTAKKDGNARRSAQTALHYILNAVVRWIAPITIFTAEEIWQNLREKNAEYYVDESIYLNKWYKLPKVNLTKPFSLLYWQQIREIRDLINQELEQNRNEQKIGSSLEAKVTIYANKENMALLSILEKELKFIFITSQVQILPYAEKPESLNSIMNNELAIAINTIDTPKCERCWQHCSSVGKNSEYGSLCKRCITNISDSEGEQRLYA